MVAASFEHDWQQLYGAGSNPRRYPDPDRIPVGARLDLPYRAGFSGVAFPALPELELSLDLDASKGRACAVLRDLPGIGSFERGGVLRLCTDA